MWLQLSINRNCDLAIIKAPYLAPRLPETRLRRKRGEEQAGRCQMKGDKSQANSRNIKRRGCQKKALAPRHKER